MRAWGSAFLIGHSFGGRVIGEIADDLNGKSIPVEMLAYIESFWSKRVIPANVRHAFNFYVPVSFAVCPGLSAIKAEDQRITQVLNVAVPDPAGPYRGFAPSIATSTATSVCGSGLSNSYGNAPTAIVAGLWIRSDDQEDGFNITTVAPQLPASSGAS